jgi:GNAT superfamily N-acetyltransferase
VRHEATSLESALEPFHKIAKDLPPLFERHWRELALNQDKIPLDPDFDRYYDLSVTGNLLVTTARADGVLVGYIFNIVGPHLHYRSTLHCEIEAFWLDPAYRGGWFPVRWFRSNEKMLKARGVKVIHVGLKNHFMAGRVGSLFRRMGYKSIETLYGKVI